MLTVKDLVVYYGKITALQGISFQVPDQSIVALIGANGAGKTTTLMAISGMVEVQSGSILLDDWDITDCQSSTIVQMGVCHVPEGRHVFPQLSVYENLLAGTIPCKKLAKGELEARIEEQFALFPRLKERYHQAAGTMSGGEQQMLAISRGLMSKPKLLMLDEPSLGLAPIIVEEIFEMITKVRASGTTVLLIEQNAYDALEISDRAYIMETGRITLEGSSSELITDERVKNAYLGGDV